MMTTYGPHDPADPTNRSRWDDFNENREHLDFRWGQGWLKGYLVAGSLLLTMFFIIHWFNWNGMIINLFIYLLISLVLLPVLTAPTVTGSVLLADQLKRFIPGVNPKVFDSYFGKVLPEAQFWALLIFGSMAVVPWHLFAWWFGPLVVGCSWFMVVHWWKYDYETKVVQTLSRWYVIFVLIIGAVFALGFHEPIGRLVDQVNPPAPYSATGTNWWTNPVTGTVFKSAPQEGCQARGDCYDPNHSSGGGGTRLVPYDAEIVKQLNSNDRLSGTSAKPQKPAPIPRLTEADYTDMVFGKFQKREVEPGQTNRIGPVTNFSGSSLCHTKSGGMGRLVIWTRADFESEPVRATLASDGISIVSFGHAGAPWQMFYGAENGTADIVLERKNQPMTC